MLVWRDHAPVGNLFHTRRLAHSTKKLWTPCEAVSS